MPPKRAGEDKDKGKAKKPRKDKDTGAEQEEGGKEKKKSVKKKKPAASATPAPSSADSRPDNLGDLAVAKPPAHNTALYCGIVNWDGPNLNKTAKKGKAAKGKAAKPAAPEPEPRPDIMGPTWIAALADEKVARVVTGCTALHFAVITEAGQLFLFGRNDQGQLGTGNNDYKDCPVKVEDLADKKVVDVAIGRRHTVAVTEDGTAFAAGDNRCGQLGNGSQKSSNKFVQVRGSAKFTKVACGADFTVLLDDAGGVWTCGHPEHGQLGHNTDGQYFVTASKLTHHWVLEPTKISLFCEKDAAGRAAPINDVVVTDISCGTNHTLALTQNNKVFSWGFGGYGRLGHSSGDTEMIPRLISNFNLPGYGAKMIAAGGTCSLAVTEAGQLMFWGQIKQSGEANTYPKPEYDLSGWAIRKIAAGNKHIVIWADDRVVSWAAAPTYGELGYGASASKSSTKAKIVDTLEGLNVIDIACGYASTLFVVQGDDGSQAKLNALGTFESHLY